MHNVCTLRRSPRKTVKNVNTQQRQLSSSESGDSNDDTEVQKPQRQKVRQAWHFISWTVLVLRHTNSLIYLL